MDPTIECESAMLMAGEVGVVDAVLVVDGVDAARGADWFEMTQE